MALPQKKQPDQKYELIKKRKALRRAKLNQTEAAAITKAQRMAEKLTAQRIALLRESTQQNVNSALQ